MNNLIRIQGKVIEVKPTKSGYYTTIKTTSSRQRAFSQWKLKEGIYSLTLRQDKEYFFIVNYQAIEVKVDEIAETEPVKQDIYQPYEEKDNQAQQKLIQELQIKVSQLQTEIQQWKNAYHNQKWMLKEAQQNAQQCTVQAKIQAIKDKPGKKSRQDLDYLQLLTEFNRECRENWAWLSAS